MDRLPAVAITAIAAIGGVLVGACSGSGGQETAKQEAPTRSRVNAVEAEAEAPVELSEFCEVFPAPSAAPKLAWPELTADAPAGGKRRWINVWATWCKPCVDELPRLAGWHDELGAKLGFDLVFLSGDGDPSAVSAFATDHPQVEGSLEVASADAVGPWLTSLGLGEAAVLPVHVFVDAEDRIRCVREAGIGDDDRKAVEQLLMQL